MRYAKLLIIVSLLFCISVARAQNVRTPITPDNATRLQPLNAVGSALPANLAYSPDGRYILAATTENTVVYRADDLTIAPKIYPFTDFMFNAAGELIADGQRWNLDTQLSIGLAPAASVLSASPDSPTTHIEITTPDRKTIRLDMGSGYEVVKVALNQDYSIAAVVVQADYHAPSLRLYRLSDGYLYVAIPQEKFGLTDLFFRASTATRPEMLIISTIDYYSSSREQQVNVYFSGDGQLLTAYSGMSNGAIRFSPDNMRFAYSLDNERVIISADGQLLEFVSENPTTPDDQNFFLDFSGQTLLIKPYGEDESADIYQFDAELKPIKIASLAQPEIYGDWAILDSDKIVFITSDKVYLWDSPDSKPTPRLIPIDTAYPHDIRMSPDGRRLAYSAEDSRRIVYDLEADTILTDAPIDAVVSPDISSLAYWEYGRLVVRDLNTLSDTIFDVIPNYIGTIVDTHLPANRIAFSGELLSVISPSITSLRHLTIPLTDPVPYGAEFVRDGNAIVVFSEQVEERSEYTYWSEYIFEEDLTEGLTYRDYGASRNFKMSPQGRYIILYDIYCNSAYFAPTTYISPFVDVNVPLPEGTARSGVIAFGCGANSLAFLAGESLFYGVDGNRLTRFEPKESEDALFWWGTDLLYYDYQADRSHSFTYSLSLSPDEESIVLFVEHYQTVYWFDGYTTLQLEGYSIELFELNNLPESLRRDDAIPTLIIPNAQTATFSPDSQMIVTDVGLYSLENGLLSAAIDGGISAFSPDSTLLATYQDGYVTLWDVRDAIVAQTPLAQYQISGVIELGFSPDTNRLYVVRGGEVQVWGIN